MNRPKSGAPSLNSLDRYAILQRKVEDLERVHVEGKKAVRLQAFLPTDCVSYLVS